MPKSLRDIVAPRAGRNVSKDELRILGDLKVDRKEDPAGNKDDVFNASKIPSEASLQTADPGMRHGYRSLKAAGQAYEETVVEQKKKKPLTPEDDRNVNGKDYGYSAGAKGNGSAVAEDVEELDELSSGVYKSAMKKASNRAMWDATGKSGPVYKKYSTMARKFQQKGMEQEKKEKASSKKEEVELDEVLKKSDSAGKWIKDFMDSDNPKFAGKSKEKRKQMALAAYYAKQRNENKLPVPAKSFPSVNVDVGMKRP